MKQSPTCKPRVKNCKIKDEKIVTLKTYFKWNGSVGNDIRKNIKQGPLLLNSGSWLIWVSLMECLDHIGCIRKVFWWFPTHCIWGVVKSFPLDKVQQS